MYPGNVNSKHGDVGPPPTGGGPTGNNAYPLKMNAFLSKKPKELQGTNIEPDHVIEGLPCVGTSRSTVTNVLATANSELADAKSVSEHDVSLPS